MCGCGYILQTYAIFTLSKTAPRLSGIHQIELRMSVFHGVSQRAL